MAPLSASLRADVTFRLAEGSSFRPLEPVGKAASSLGMRVTQGRNWSLLWSWRSPWTDAVTAPARAKLTLKRSR